MYLKNVNKLLKNDLKLVLTAVKQNSRASIFMDPSLWSNKTIVMQVLRGNGLSLESASNELKNDYDIVLTAVQENGMALEFVPAKYLTNNKIVKAALNADGRALKFCLSKQKNNPSLIRLAVENNIKSIRYAEVPEAWFGQDDKSTYVAYLFEHGIGVAKNLPKAKSLYTKSAESGDTDAMLRLAYLYLEGRGTNRDYDKSYQWFSLAADSGSIDGITMLGFMKQNAFAVNKDIDGAIELYTEALARSLNIKTRAIDPNLYKGGDAQAAYLLARLYDLMVPQSAQKSELARAYYLIAAEQGYLKAQISLAKLYFTGKHGPRSFKNSLKWFSKAARQGSLDAILASGLHYDIGLDVDIDVDEAKNLYQDAIISGFPGLHCLMNTVKRSDTKPSLGMEINDYIRHMAESGVSRFQCLLGSYYDRGVYDYNQNKQEAYEWMKKSAKQGNPEAQVYLSRVMYSKNNNTREVKLASEWLDKALAQKYPKSYTLKAETYLSDEYSKDYDNAIKWLLKAADLNEREAQRKLGILYNRGDGVAKNQKVAFDWFEKASFNGDHIAMFNMATMYEFGNGISKNEEKAILWYKKSASLGNKQAAENLKILEDQGVNIHKVQLHNER